MALAVGMKPVYMDKRQMELVGHTNGSLIPTAKKKKTWQSILIFLSFFLRMLQTFNFQHQKHKYISGWEVWLQEL